LLGTRPPPMPLRLGPCNSDAAHSGIDALSTDGICALCGRHPHFNAPKYEIAALVLTIRRPPAWRYLIEKGLGADIMAVCSAPMCRRTIKHSVLMYPPPIHDEHSARASPTW